MVVIIKKTIFDLLRRRVLYADKVRKKLKYLDVFCYRIIIRYLQILFKQERNDRHVIDHWQTQLM